MFGKILIANRGEIAVRIIRTLRELGIASVAVYSDADAGARHVREADEAIRIGPPPAAESYLSVEAVIGAARAAGAQAIHPGYGFLAESARFARACAAAGITFIGPPPEAIEAMGDKIAAKATVAAAGVPVVPGAGAPGLSDGQLIALLNGHVFPLLVKPSAGGGGKGMRVVRAPGELPAALAAARREARAAFGDDTLLVEKYIDAPRHIEVQVLADAHGTVVHLGERECSLQRRHQKIIEEAPSPLLDAARREAMGTAAVEAARSVGYTGAGTVEFIVRASPGRHGTGGYPPAVPHGHETPGEDSEFEFYFLEMNTRLQVEHAVTEMVTGLDLVEWQVRIAAGERLPFTVSPPPRGHAAEARVYAEDPARGFLPTGGTVRRVREPGGTHVRVDSGLAEGMAVTSAYDPMLAKVIAWAPDRAGALRRLDAALAETAVLGVTTNVAFLRALLRDPAVQAGRLDTGLAERLAREPGSVPGEVLAAAALERLLAREPRGTAAGPWDIPDGWRVGGPAWTRFRLSAGTGNMTEVRVRGLPSAGAEVAVGDGDPVRARVTLEGDRLSVQYANRVLHYLHAADGRTVWLGRDGQAWAVTEERAAPVRGGTAAAAGGTVRSPMPGTVLAVHVTAGQRVAAGQPLLVVEAMKMEHAVTAPADGVVTELSAKPGQQVGMDETVAVIGPLELASDAQLPA